MSIMNNENQNSVLSAVFRTTSMMIMLAEFLLLAQHIVLLVTGLFYILHGVAKVMSVAIR